MKIPQRTWDVVIIGSALLTAAQLLWQREWVMALWPLMAASFYWDARTWRRLYIGTGKHMESE